MPHTMPCHITIIITPLMLMPPHYYHYAIIDITLPLCDIDIDIDIDYAIDYSLISFH
jgi:hypothetical protein